VLIGFAPMNQEYAVLPYLQDGTPATLLPRTGTAAKCLGESTTDDFLHWLRLAFSIASQIMKKPLPAPSAMPNVVPNLTCSNLVTCSMITGSFKKKEKFATKLSDLHQICRLKGEHSVKLELW